MSSLTYHFKEEYLIPYATGLNLNPILNRSNVHVVGNYDRNTCKLVIDDFSAMNEGLYKCQYIKNNSINNRVFKVLVIYPPDLTLHMYNLSDGVKLLCNASGVPSAYQYEDWEHRSELNEHIRYRKGTHNGHLIIQDNQYQNSGIYICNVTNGVSSKNGNIFQTRQISIPYEGQPMFVFGDDKTHYGQYGKEINVAFNIFSSSELRVTIVKMNRRLTFKALVKTYNSTYQGYLKFHGLNITILCTKFSFSFLLSGTDDFTSYTVEVCNEHGCNNSVIEIVSDTVTEKKHDSEMLSLWISVGAIVIASILGFGIFVSLKIKMKGIGESVENRLYQSADNLEATAVRSQSPDRYDVDVLSTVSTRSIVLTRNQEETPEQRFHDTRISQIGNPNLNYADLVFEAAGSSTETQSRAFVHGAEDRTLYSEIDLLHRASESDDDDFMYIDGIQQFTLKDNKHAT
ncbi:unnamed protein product [Mytilus coruscus]|uniref:Ig-like domain-containing protein n=1 Tax=Mytilus coruscus TaxID=42192 RepID=A0A6J8CA62_MYTCO|nr:unnamed protein product [Mytilus coruscus]